MVGRFAPALALARADARRRWRTWLVAVLVVGVLAGGLFAVLAGARRTASAYDRLRTAASSPDVVFTPCRETLPTGECPASSEQDLRALEVQPEVTAVSYGHVYSGAFTLGDGRGYQEQCNTGSGEAALVAPTGTPFGPAVERPVVIAGRAADPTRVDEVVVGVAAHDTGARIGDTLVAELGEFCPDDDSPPPKRIELHVVGVVADTLGLRPELGSYIRTIYATPALDEWARANAITAVPVAFAKTVSGAPFIRGILQGTLYIWQEDQTRRAAIERSVDPDTLVLLLMGGLGAALALMVVAPAFVRVEREVRRDAPALRALGCTRRELLAAGLLHGIAVAVPAALVAVLVAIALSPELPVGDARSFEPAPGVSVDWVVLGPGVVALVLLTVVLTTVTAGTHHRAGPSAEKTSGVGARLADRLRVPPVGRLGTRFAFDAVAGRVASGAGRVATTVVALVGVVGALTFSAGLSHLLASPRLVGWNWDALAFVDADRPGLVDALRATPGVERMSIGTLFDPGSAGFSIGRTRDASWPMSLSDGPDAVPFTVIDGRGPAGDHEMIVHPRLLETLGLSIGDRTIVNASDARGGRRSEVTIVGTGVMPVDAQEFETASGMTYDGLTALFGSPNPLETEIVVVDFADWVDIDALSAELAAKGLTDATGLMRGDGDGFGGRVVAALTAENVDEVPGVLAALAALLGAGVLVHLLAARRAEWRRELALHRAMGFTRGGVRASVSVGGALVALLAAAIAVPIGVVVGQRAWLLHAESLGVKPEAAVPWGWLLIVGAATVVVAVASVLVAGALDRRPVAEALRAE